MKIGTRSVLFGAHQFVIHPITLFFAWWTLYGFPFDPRLWVAFAIHDIGYVGKPNMDGPEGETHPELGARIMGFLFGHKWKVWTLLHSRFHAQSLGMGFSQLCVADKLATLITPLWIYLPLVRLSGEIVEYRRQRPAREPAFDELVASCQTDMDFVFALRTHMYAWIIKNRTKGLTVSDCHNPITASFAKNS